MPDISPKYTAAIDGILSESSTMTLSTLDPDGSPRSTPLYFVSDDRYKLYFISDSESIHSKNLSRNSHSSVAIYPHEPSWEKLRGMQMKGHSYKLKQTKLDQIIQLYTLRFPFVAQLQSLLSQSQIYFFSPEWIRLIDNRVRLGFSREWSLTLLEK